MDLMEASFKIKKENQEKALEAIKGLTGKETITGYSGEDHFSWVTTEEFLIALHLEDALEAWRWTVEFDEGGDIIDIGFNGEKYGDDIILFNAIAPFVEDGYIQMKGEDDAVWRWSFKDGVCKEIMGKVTVEFPE